VGALAFAAAACQQSKSANPLSPDVAGPIPGVTITAPRNLEPFVGQQIEATQQPLTFLIENASWRPMPTSRTCCTRKTESRTARTGARRTA
jgi:hypothetical protein